MKKILLSLIFILILSTPVFCKTDKVDLKNGSFTEFGRYINNLEINEPINNSNDSENNEDDNFNIFEKNAIDDIAKRFESNAIELKLDDIDDDALNTVNSARLYKLQVNEAHYNLEQNIKTENIIWDNSKSYMQSVYTSSRHLVPIPSVVNSSKLNAQISSSLCASLGQTNLYDATNNSALFIRANESTYNTGSVISYKNESLNIAVGSFTSSYNQASSGGVIISSKKINLPYDMGNFVLGGGYFSKEEQDNDKSTSGGFIQYSLKNLKLSAQIGQSKYANSSVYNTSLYLIPELKLTDSISLKTRLIRNITQDTMQDEFALTYKPKNNKNNLEFEINASNQYTQNSTINQRIKFSTSFRI